MEEGVLRSKACGGVGRTGAAVGVDGAVERGGELNSPESISPAGWIFGEISAGPNHETNLGGVAGRSSWV